MEELATTIGKRIRKVRELREMSQDELASRCNVHRMTITRIENGKGNPQVSTLQAISKALECPAKALFPKI